MNLIAFEATYQKLDHYGQIGCNSKFGPVFRSGLELMNGHVEAIQNLIITPLYRLDLNNLQVRYSDPPPKSGLQIVEIQ